MLPLKEAIAEKHSLAEKMPFNQRMFKGELSNEEYVLYLAQQFAIFNKIERFSLPHPALNRSIAVLNDIKELLKASEDESIEITPIQSTLNYTNYLNTLTQEQLLPHVYLNYLAIMFGGQMMKKNVPGSGKMYEFDGDMREIAGSIRAIQKDEWADEANKALDFNIEIFKELQTISDGQQTNVG
jgi:heme oxygenase